MRHTHFPRSLLAVTVLSTAALLAACGSNVKLDEAPVETRTGQPADASGAAGQAAAPGPAPAAKPAEPAAAAQSRVATVDAARTAAAAAAGWPAERVVYFDFDSFVLRPDAKPVVEAHAKVLMAQRGKRLVVEGHTDERGGREYNLALGQKRAEAVTRSLVLLGVSESQVEAVSFGKERPVDEGHDESAWAKNRRAELKEKR